ncbi:hypothetical protein GTQ34_15610 [Muricauda sp. JGD-17]|uniref:Uncharacterized protein n=1 Tax=Flagellimonas ochracea TaxID=2696472 RepID=A0A964WYV8_9FLAO|nr:hypothetical protein [Allomuricauda ochracea]NAY93337.1 hypothetical protein [Allomuricauda ochracea]
MFGEDGNFILCVDGIEALFENRAEHLKRYLEVRNKIQYLAETDNRLIMHDKVWLTPDKLERSLS